MVKGTIIKESSNFQLICVNIITLFLQNLLFTLFMYTFANIFSKFQII